MRQIQVLLFGTFWNFFQIFLIRRYGPVDMEGRLIAVFSSILGTCHMYLVSTCNVASGTERANSKI